MSGPLSVLSFNRYDYAVSFFWVLTDTARSERAISVVFLQAMFMFVYSLIFMSINVILILVRSFCRILSTREICHVFNTCLRHNSYY